MIFFCNARIIRTTHDWIKQNPAKLSDTFMLIQWSTWEREEWFYQDQWWQVNASGTDHVPPELQEKYDLENNKGYGTKKHMDGIKQHGISEWHRRSFGICKNY